MPATEDDKIAPTAHYTAYVWYRLGMPHGELFATPLGASLFWGFRLAGEAVTSRLPSVPSMTQYLELRHRTIDRALLDGGADRVAEVGAGLSRRGVTWAADRGVPYVEIDLPAMVALKTRVLAERGSRALLARLSGRLSHLACDALEPGFEGRLARLLSGAESPAVVAEGVLGYFAPRDRLRLARAVAEGLAPTGGVFLCELRTRARSLAMGSAVRVLKAGIRVATAGRGTREDFEDDEHVRRFFEEAGFADAEPLPPPDLPHLAGLSTPARVWRARV